MGCRVLCGPGVFAPGTEGMCTAVAATPDMERLVAQYGSTLLRMCCAYLGDAHLADDAVQDTFIKVYRSWREFDTPAAEKAWVMRVAVNVCKDYLRSAWRRKVHLVEEYPEIAGEEEQPKEDNILLEEIMALKPRYRQVILLHYYQQLSVGEIARILSAPQSTVSVRLRRARAILLKRLEARGYADQ